MNLSWTPQQQHLLSFYRALGVELAEARRSAEPGFDHYGWQRLCDAGLWKRVIPLEYGGLGEDWWGFSAALEGLASSIRTPELLLSVIAQAGTICAGGRPAPGVGATQGFSSVEFQS